MFAMSSVGSTAKPEEVHADKQGRKEKEKPVIADPFHDLPPFLTPFLLSYQERELKGGLIYSLFPFNIFSFSPI
jgi:hypothetical protein